MEIKRILYPYIIEDEGKVHKGECFMWALYDEDGKRIAFCLRRPPLENLMREIQELTP